MDDRVVRRALARLCICGSVIAGAATLSSGCANSTQAGAVGQVLVERVPGDGLVADIAVGPGGTVHLVSVEGTPDAGDVMYRHRASSATAWSAPMRVNRTAGAGLAIGAVRGPRIVEGRRGLVHVLWNGSSKVTTDQKRGAPLLYARIDGTRVSDARSLMTTSTMLDGGGAVAADQDGHVYALWHGLIAPRTRDAERNAFLSVSADDGGSFAAERVVNPENSGVCGCCGMAATVSPGTGLLWLVRAATGDKARDMMLMRLDRGAPAVLLRDPWQLEACPLSTSALANTATGAVAAWETRGQILTAEVIDGRAGRPVPAPGTGQRRFPAVALNGAGDVLLAWTEGAAWGRGGSLAWVLLEHGSRRELAAGTVPSLRPWTKPAVYARPDGRFVVLY